MRWTGSVPAVLALHLRVHPGAPQTRGYHGGSPTFAHLREERPVGGVELREKVALEDFGELLEQSHQYRGLGLMLLGPLLLLLRRLCLQLAGSSSIHTALGSL